MGQVITFLAVDGRWRALSLVPIPVAASVLAVLLTKDIAGPFFAVILSGAAGLVALAIVWAAWGRSARKRDATGST